VVGLTSVGSGSLIIVVLLALYPSLRANDLVGTDLVQAIPMVAAAALGHAFFGDLRLDLAAAVLIGSVPGVLLGSRLSSRAPGGFVRAALIVVLLASALKLFGVANGYVVGVPAAVALVAVAIAVRQRVAERLRAKHAGDPRGEDPRGEDPRGEDPRGEDPRGEDPRGEDPRGEVVRREDAPVPG
jgi:hypothetical protein